MRGRVGRTDPDLKEADVVAAPRTYQLVLDRIEEDLLAGRLGVGGRLPGERILAERYGVSRASVREAIKVLEAMGMIRTGVGSGPEAGAVIIAEPAAPIAMALRWHLASSHLPVADIVGARVLIESWSVAGVAARIRRAEPVDLTPVLGLLQAMDAPGLPRSEFLALDAEFHVTLADLAGNVVVAAMMAAMRQGIQAYVTQAVGRVGDWDVMSARLRTEHRGIVRAIDDGDPAQASAAVVAHINGFYADTGVG